MSQLINKTKGFIADKVAHIQKPEADLTDVDLKHFSRESVTFDGKLDVSNPYSHSIPICQISFKLKSHDKVIGSGTVPDPGSLAAEQKTRLNVPVKVPYSILMDLARDVGADCDIDYCFEIGLTVDLPIIGNFTIPLSKNGELKLPSISDIF
ncbi:hypothetical protein GIB67_008271 [Kingdonia uniflora]|uniref:Water stress and hypersensitive response domain-containing protein n=1 Tax=Kingdonia uniflora TaxID=39325 RepID=A0A7J7N526_9MAGN|nr:hypothetical protein GIB67_008271 [Kingdonia uniflora]